MSRWDGTPSPEVCVHQGPGVRRRLAVEVHELGVEQVERGDVEGRGDRDAGTAIGEAPGEVQPGTAVVQAAVDVRRGHVEQVRRVHRLGRAGEDAHRELRGGRAHRRAPRDRRRRGRASRARAHPVTANGPCVTLRLPGATAPYRTERGGAVTDLRAVMLNCTLKYAPRSPTPRR